MSNDYEKNVKYTLDTFQFLQLTLMRNLQPYIKLLSVLTRHKYKCVNIMNIYRKIKSNALHHFKFTPLRI